MKVARVLGWALAGACVAMSAAGADQVQMQVPAYSLPQEVVSDATAFEAFMASAAKIDAGFSDGDTVNAGLKTAAAYEPQQMEEGMVAYGAIIALQDARFVAGVDHAAGQGDDRAAYAEQLVQDPFSVTQVDGAEEAARRIEAALGDKASALLKVGTQVTAAAYSVQHQGWSQAAVADAEGRLAEVKARSQARAAPSDDDNQAMLVAISAGDPTAAAGGDAAAGVTSIEARALALAAESVLGRAHGADRDRLRPLFSEVDSAECLRIAKLNLYQCMAVAGPQYEDIYCMGQHALTDTAQCVASAAHGQQTQIASDAEPPPADQPPADRSYVRVASRQSSAPN
jgi:hypothetical protein